MTTYFNYLIRLLKWLGLCQQRIIKGHFIIPHLQKLGNWKVFWKLHRRVIERQFGFYLEHAWFIISFGRALRASGFSASPRTKTQFHLEVDSFKIHHCSSLSSVGGFIWKSYGCFWWISFIKFVKSLPKINFQWFDSLVWQEIGIVLNIVW